MENFFVGNNCQPIDANENNFCFVGEYTYGRRIVGIYTDKMYYGIQIKGEVVSPWFEKLVIMPNFNICQKGKKNFLTSPDGKRVISSEYKEIEDFRKLPMLNRYYAKTEDFEGKYGTVSSEGKTGIECSQEELTRFGSAFAVCGKEFNGQLRYGIFGVDGEKVVDYKYVCYVTNGGKVCLKSPEGELVAYDIFGVLIKK